jgi:signal transduction histidine kinase
VKGYTSLIRAKAAPGSQEATWADRALESLESMEMHLNLLSIYRTRGISDVSETEWSEILDEVGAALRFFNKKNLPVRVKSDVQGKFFLRKELLKRGLVHILRNACESMKNGGTVSFFSCLQNGEELGGRACPSILVKVTDEGDGISDSRKSSIWKPFYTTKPNHFGLGLTYVVMVASLLDARIHLESREGFGTAVSLVIRPEGGEVETR